MAMIIFVGAILSLTAIVWFIGRIFSVNVCPICAGVSLTWLASLLGMYSGILSISDFQLPTAILMGGSVVGIAYKLEDRLRGGRSQLLWKTIFISLGFAFMYALILFNLSAIIIFGLPLLFTVFFFIEKKNHSKKVDELVEKMEKCC